MLLLLLLFSVTNCGFTLMATEVTFEPIPVDQTYCDDDSCAQYVCQLLSNTSLGIAYVMLLPMSKNFQCPIVKYNIPTNIITFIVNQQLNISQPLLCTTTNSCLTVGCQSYKNNPNSFMFAFTGQCYSSIRT